MALGKQTGAFAFKATSLTVTPGPGKAMTMQANFEGPQTGDVTAAAYGTLTVVIEPGAKTGPWRWCGVALLENGDNMNATGEGTWERTSPKAARYRGIAQFSDGSTAAVEADLHVDERSMAGKLYEWK
jgi:hypothetical protein